MDISSTTAQTSLRNSAQPSSGMEQCRQILLKLKEMDVNNFFTAPVDPVALNIPDYFAVIKEPMDLGTIENRLNVNTIDSVEEFARLVRLTFQNAIMYNSQPENPVHQGARTMLAIFNSRFGTARSIIEREREEVELVERCKQLEVAYIPPGDTETKAQTLKRRELLSGWCRDYENKKKPAAATATAGGGESVNNFLLVGTLSYVDKDDVRRHVIRGNWNCNKEKDKAKGNFCLVRNIPPEEDVKQLPMGGVYKGSFTFQTKIENTPIHKVTERRVALRFKKDKDRDREGEYSINGKGTNVFGAFELVGTATPGEEGRNEYNIKVHKRYISRAALPAPEGEKEKKKKEKKRKLGDSVDSKNKGEVTNSTPNSKRSRTLPTLVTPESKKPAVEASRKGGSLHPTVSVGSGLTKKKIITLSTQERKCSGVAEMKQQKESNQPTKREVTEAKAPSANNPFTSYDHFVYSAKLAGYLQREEERKAKEDQKMYSTKTGLAYKLVEKIKEKEHSLKKEHGDTGISVAAVDDMVFMTEKMLICQETFRDNNKNTNVDIGFHFTSEAVLKHIQRDGLMTMEDRESNPKLNPQEASRKHGLVFGDGVYTGNTPVDLKRYGNVGLLVIRLQGNAKRIHPNDVEVFGTLERTALRVKESVGTGQKAKSEGYDTVIGNKSPSKTRNRDRYDEIVLLQSSQVVPVLKFNASLIQDGGTEIPPTLVPWLNAMKTIVDDFFNKPETLLEGTVDDVGASSSTAAQKPSILNSTVDRKLLSNLGAAKKPPPNSRIPGQQRMGGGGGRGGPAPFPPGVAAATAVSSAPSKPSSAKKPAAAPAADPQPMEFGDALKYVTTIKKRFHAHPEIYRKFLKILHTYQKEQRGIKEVLDEVSVLFADHADLIKGFTYFLPDAVRSQAKAQLDVAAAKAEERAKQRAAQTKAAGKGHLSMIGSPLGVVANQPSPSLPPAAATKNKNQAQKASPISGAQAKVNNGWQNGDGNAQERHKIVDSIVRILRQQYPRDTTNASLEKLTSIAKQLDCSLYISAPSFEAYKDTSTLWQRLKQLTKNNSAGTSQSSSLRRSSSTATVLEEVIQYNAPDTLLSSDTNLLEIPMEGTFNSSDTCVICQDDLGQDVTTLSKSKMCNHVFHKECLLQSLRYHGSKCPCCNTGIREPIGKSPSGKMQVSTNGNMSCEGFSEVGTIVIDYTIFKGKQKEYHEEKGKEFAGISRRAFMPDNEDGRILLKRLKWAFSHGLTFRIGTSSTTNQSGVVTWSSVHHKTRPTKGEYGWPDFSYFLNCNKELDNLGVPKAGDCS